MFKYLRERPLYYGYYYRVKLNRTTTASNKWRKKFKSQNLNKSIYCGFDPAGDLLHAGHLIQIILSETFHCLNFKPVAIIGGGTGMIGDHNGKNQKIFY